MTPDEQAWLDALLAAEQRFQNKSAVVNQPPRVSEMPADALRGLLDTSMIADQAINEGLDYYLGPTGIPDKLRAVAGLLDPGVYETGYAAADLIDPRTSDIDRFNASRDVSMAMALAPLSFIKAGDDAVRGAVNSVKGDISAVRRDIADRLTQPGAMPTTYSNPIPGLMPKIDPVTVRGSDIMGLLKSGRADEVTDEMLDMGDAVQNARLNEYLWNNYDLPMDAASRAERRDALRHKGGLYSGTGEDFTGFNSQAWATTNPDLAYTYAPSEGGTVMPLTMRAKHGAPVIEGGGANWNRLTPSMRAGGPMEPYIPGLASKEEAAAYGEDVLRTQDFVNAAKEQGLSGVTFNDIVDVGGYFNKYYPPGPEREAQLASLKRAGQPSVVEARSYPNQVRSAFARFDPRMSHLKNLNAALAAGIFPLGLLAAQPNEEQY